MRNSDLAKDNPHEDSPKDRFITIYGRKPVLEALNDKHLPIDKIVLADNAHGQSVHAILTTAEQRGISVHRTNAHRVKLLAGNGRHDQGVLADVLARRMRPLSHALREGLPQSVLLLDGLTTPANVGMILRSATAAGIGGIVVPHKGVAGLDPLVIKASAGVAFHAPILRCRTAGEAASALREAGYRLFALDAGGEIDLFAADLPVPVAFVLGSESAGLSNEVRRAITARVSVPMSSTVESLNVASAAAIVCFELRRRGLTD